MRRAVELSNVHHVVLVLQDRRLVVVDVEVVGRREDGDERREPRSLALAVHPVPGVLGFVGADNRQQVVLLKEIAARRVTIEVGAASYGVVAVVFGGGFGAEVLDGVGPQQVAHGSEGGRLAEPIQHLDVVERVHFGRQTAVNAQELLVHERRQGEAVERVHAGVVNAFGVLDATLLLEREIVGEMAALVVTPEHVYGVGVQDLQRPQI